MKPDQYTQEKGAPLGSSAYYAVLRAPASRRRALTALFALRRELEETVEQSSDTAVGHAKLAWWQRELATIADGQPTHPVAIELRGALDATQAEQTVIAFADIAEGFAMDLAQARYLDLPGLQQYVRKIGGTFSALLAAQSKDGADDREWAFSAGVALIFAEIVRDIGDDARRGRIYIPISEMQQFNVTAADIINRRYSDHFTALMRFQLDRARDGLRAALAAASRATLKRQPVIRAQIAIALALLDEIEGEQYQVLHQRIALTPVRKLWVAFRATRLGI
ncbi:squalene/phytoene synthase family protein [Pararobbsia silviterrae]|uniref:Squalene synthase HpnD n=1 Tax=Pararobbsia silviterrae TaxID=1792498 RepID=A0A494XVT6_9BURK|nr:squalene/phytoene synthase family protein [Pararobbsia silviterrae]RKP54733.1 squalene synthase HpnD [Pararobbsia silviterrae]